MSSVCQNMSSRRPVMHDIMAVPQTIFTFIKTSKSTIIITMVIILIYSLADAWLSFINFLEKVFQLLLWHCLSLKSFFRGRYECLHVRLELNLSGNVNTLIIIYHKYNLWIRRSGKQDQWFLIFEMRNNFKKLILGS